METGVKVCVETVVVIKDSAVSSGDVIIVVEVRDCEFLVIVTDVRVRELEDVTE